MSPPETAAMNRSVTWRCTAGSTAYFGRRACTWDRARCAICRTEAGERPSSSAISPCAYPKTSASTNTARSAGRQ